MLNSSSKAPDVIFVMSPEFTVRLYAQGLLVWDSRFRGSRFTTVLAHVVDGFAAHAQDAANPLFHVQRFAEDDKHRAMFSTSVFDSTKPECERYIKSLVTRELTRPLREGPTVLDLPILPTSVVFSCFGWNRYPDGVPFRCNGSDYVRLYKEADTFANQLPKGLLSAIPWYKSLVKRELNGFQSAQIQSL